ncbi:dicarboxylate/amino acid:cation symporter [Pseudalkalibacillus berkeleyi]|uniref:Dicarboxylate/amino acid:cation symporter n=1 Tax=Pseudalkalibacillus berkeleyi TaxID=1069813 RepID=A0ABS9H1V3_9BACL|nr:dicarboxylate/amino acid:cation symporter [Pseudalkalibacillus berkeleyi]MCF6138962.1 dicarboxylate/amino acid:cation symporter [Pseudalkalibacillus berkeleyi]
MKLSIKIIIGLVLGIIVGLLLNIFSPDAFSVLDKYIFGPVGKLFLNLIKMLVVPIVFFSIALGAAGIGDPKKLGRIGGKTIGYFLVTTSIALVIALSLGTLIQPGAGGGFDTEQASFDGGEEAPPVVETLLNIIPTNPIDSMAKGDMLQIIAFAIFVGFAVAVLGEKTKTVHRILEEGNDILMYLVNIVMLLAPYGAFALIASAVGGFGLDALQAMGLYFGTVVLALLLHAVITYGTAVSTLGKMNPIAFFKGFAPAMSVAFSTSSSSGTLPVSMKTAQENLKVPKQVSSFVQPLGATINMDGTAIMQGVATVFIAQVYAIDLSMADLVTVVLTAVLASIGTAGVPGVGLIMLAMVLNQVGLPVEAIGLVLGVDRLLDMTRTAVNITGDASCAVIVARTEEKHGGSAPKVDA